MNLLMLHEFQDQLKNKYNSIITKYNLHQKELAAEHGKDKQLLCVQIATLVSSEELSKAGFI